jgi:hypothetical protein
MWDVALRVSESTTSLGCLSTVQRAGFAQYSSHPYPRGVGTEHAVIGRYLCCHGVSTVPFIFFSPRETPWADVVGAVGAARASGGGVTGGWASGGGGVVHPSTRPFASTAPPYVALVVNL